MADGQTSLWTWRLGALHTFVGLAILFATLHPLRDALDAHRLALAQTGSTLEALNGLGLLWLSARAQRRIAIGLVALGTTLFSVMLYLIAFAGDQPLEALVPVGGTLMLLGWGKLMFERP